MQKHKPDAHGAAADDAVRIPFEALERRVLAMAQALVGAREARLEAESKVKALQGRVRKQDAEIARLKDEIGNDRLRESVRTRLESLLKRVDELERQG